MFLFCLSKLESKTSNALADVLAPPSDRARINAMIMSKVIFNFSKYFPVFRMFHISCLMAGSRSKT